MGLSVGELEEGEGDLGADLEAAEVSTERFIGALFRAIEPYTLMMADLCEFFERHDVRRTDEGLRIRFDFEDVDEELTFDLEHFREWLRTWEVFRATVDVLCWDVFTLWALCRCFDEEVLWEARRAGPRHPAAHRWWARNTYPGRHNAREHWTSPVPPAPFRLGVPEVDDWVERVYGVLLAVAWSCGRYGDWESLSAAAAASGENTPAGFPDNPTPLLDWHPQALRALESDYFAGALAATLYIWIEDLRSFSAEEIADRARRVVERLTGLFGSLPTTPIETDVRVESLIEFLNLPVWKQRHSLYQAWMLPVIEQALFAYPVELHHSDGTLTFRFAATRLATFATQDGEVDLIAEQRTPLAAPRGKGRTAGIQPDFVLTFEPERGLGRAIVVIETKQYLRPNVQNFADALTDYASGHPEAMVILADYGPMSPSVLARVPGELIDRTLAVGDVRPRSSEAMREVQRAIASSALPPPPEEETMDGAPFLAGLDLVAVDVSGSMRSALEAPGVLEELRLLAERNPSARWLAVDETVRFDGVGAAALDGVLAVSRTGGTSLVPALAGANMLDAAVITDGDGQSQLEGRIRPRALGLVTGACLEWIQGAPAGG